MATKSKDSGVNYKGARYREGKDNKAFTVGVELPDGEKLISTPTGLRIEKTTINEIVFDTKEEAQKAAKNIANVYRKDRGIKAKPYVGKPWQGEKDKPKAQSRSSNVVNTKGAKAAQSAGAKPAKPTTPKKPAAPKATTFTVKGKTFATKAEAKAFEQELKKKGKTTVIKEGNRKPSHRVVIFAAKSK